MQGGRDGVLVKFAQPRLVETEASELVDVAARCELPARAAHDHDARRGAGWLGLQPLEQSAQRAPHRNVDGIELAGVGEHDVGDGAAATVIVALVSDRACHAGIVAPLP